MKIQGSTKISTKSTKLLGKKMLSNNIMSQVLLLPAIVA